MFAPAARPSVRVILVLDPHQRAERRGREAGDIALPRTRRRAARARRTRRRRCRRRRRVRPPPPARSFRLDAEAGDDLVGLDTRRRSGERLTSPSRSIPSTGSPATTSTPLLRYSSVTAATSSAGKTRPPMPARGRPCDPRAVHRQRRGDLRADEPAADARRNRRPAPHAAHAPVIVKCAEIDDAVSPRGNHARTAAGREHEPLVCIPVASIIHCPAGREIKADDPTTEPYVDRRLVEAHQIELSSAFFHSPLVSGGRL